MALDWLSLAANLGEDVFLWSTASMIELIQGEFWIVHRWYDFKKQPPLVCLSTPLWKFQLMVIKVHKRGTLSSWETYHTMKYPCTNKKVKRQLYWSVCYEELPQAVNTVLSQEAWGAETLYFKSWILLKWFSTQKTRISPIDPDYDEFSALAQKGKLPEGTSNSISGLTRRTCQTASLA